MKRQVVETRSFSKSLDSLLHKRKVLLDDYNSFKKELAENPKMGDTVAGAGGIRKTRLKSASKGKRGGFRVCYYYLESNELIYLLCLYAKNEQEDLSADEKKSLKNIANVLKRTKNG
jgi:hypothetical protein